MRIDIFMTTITLCLCSVALCDASSVPALPGTGTVTWGDSTWDPAMNLGTAEVLWQGDTMLGGFQFNIPDVEVLSVTPLECNQGWGLFSVSNGVLCLAMHPANSMPPSETPVELVTIMFSCPAGSELSFINPVFASDIPLEMNVTADDVLIIGALPCPDIDDDGQVGLAELLQIIDSWGDSASSSDPTGDGRFDMQDLMVVFLNWGPCQ